MRLLAREAPPYAVDAALTRALSTALLKAAGQARQKVIYRPAANFLTF